MNKHKAIFAFTIALLSLVYTAGFCAESTRLVEEKETGAIDWAKGTVQAKGISAPIKKDAGKSPTNSPKALSEAKNDARRKLLETVKRIQIASKLSVGDIADRNKTIMNQIKEMVYDAGEIEKSRKYMSDGSVEVSLQMNLHGGFAQLILPKGIRQIETIKQLKSGEKSSAGKPSASTERASNIYTGLLVDARSIKATPALAPKLLDENLAEVFRAGLCQSRICGATGDGCILHGYRGSQSRPQNFKSSFNRQSPPNRLSKSLQPCYQQCRRFKTKKCFGPPGVPQRKPRRHRPLPPIVPV